MFKQSKERCFFFKIYKDLCPVLDRVKFFGFRKLYYICKNLKFWIVEFLTDLGLIRKQFKQGDLISRKVSRQLILNYIGPAGDPSHNVDIDTYFPGFALFHYTMIRNTKPDRVLAVGSRTGFIPAALALACKDNEKGSVDFVDAGYERGHPKVWGGKGLWKEIEEENYFKSLELNKWINLYVMELGDFAEKFPQRKYSYIYIDGDHSYQGVKLDYELFWPKLKQFGFMAFHDVVVKNWKRLKNFGVWKLWKELEDRNKIIFPFPARSGLGILQKTKKESEKIHKVNIN